MEYPAFTAGGLRCEFEHGMRAIEYTLLIFLGKRFFAKLGRLAPRAARTRI